MPTGLPLPTPWEQFWASLRDKEQDEILRARKRLEVETSQSRYVDPKTGHYPPDRARIHKKIVDKFLDDIPESEKPWATIIIGPPASGKNTFLGKHPDLLKNAVLIDNDEIKARLPGFEPALAGVYHQESEYVETLLFIQTMASSRSFVMLRVGKNTEALRTTVLNLKEGGYRIRLILLDLNPVEAARRALDRFLDGGRYVDPEYIVTEVALTPIRTYVTLQKEVNEYARYSAQEAPPHLAEQGP